MGQVDLAPDLISQISQQFDTSYIIDFDCMPWIFPTSIICRCPCKPEEANVETICVELSWMLCLLHKSQQGVSQLLWLLSSPEQHWILGHVSTGTFWPGDRPWWWWRPECSHAHSSEVWEGLCTGSSHILVSNDLWTVKWNSSMWTKLGLTPNIRFLLSVYLPAGALLQLWFLQLSSATRVVSSGRTLKWDCKRKYNLSVDRTLLSQGAPSTWW